MADREEASTFRGLQGISHGFFTRVGGVSDGIYGALNCGLGSRDETTRVKENRRRVAAALRAPAAPVLTCYQVHSADAVLVEGAWPAGAQPKADALVTRTPGLILGALAADCAPVLFADPEAGVVAAAHAGWKGALGGILEATVRCMEGAGARRSAIRAALGPCIGPEAYEVGHEFVQQFCAFDTTNVRFFRHPPGAARPHFDLPGFVLGRLDALGLASVENLTRCTYRNEAAFFSYRRATHRRESDYGRQISAIVLL